MAAPKSRRTDWRGAMQKTLDELDPPCLDPGTLAIFLDFDGTLVDLAEHPWKVVVPPETKTVLKTLARASKGALALVSGRPIADLDRLLTPLRLPTAGVHGLERRDAGGAIHSGAIDEAAVAELGDKLQRFVADLPGLFLEPKPGSIALHYRGRPELEQSCLDTMRHCAAASGRFEMLHGKMVIEAKVGCWSKADAVAAFMREAPFRGRLPLFAGDDVTDEAAFGKIAEVSGISIKVGSGATCALYRSASPCHFRAWLGNLSRHFADRAKGDAPEEGSN